MNKFKWLKDLDAKDACFILILSLIFGLPCILLPMKYFSIMSFAKLFITVLFFIIFTTLLPLSIGKNLIVLLPVFLISLLESGYFFVFKTPINSNIYSTIFASNQTETIEFIKMYANPLSSLLILFFGVYIWGINYFLLKRITINIKVKVLSIIITFVIGFLGFGKLKERVFPLTTINKLLEYRNSRNKFLELSKQRSMLKYASPKISSSYKNIVLIIGESARRDDLYSILNKESVTIFRDVISGATQTIDSLKFALTEASPESPELFFKSPSLIKLMSQLGFKTYWISNQYELGLYETETTAIANEADNKIFIRSANAPLALDIDLIPHLKTTIKEEGKKLIILHTMGSHGDYIERYPQNKYKSIGVNKTERLRSEYNNSIKETNEFINKTLEVLKEYEDTSLIYFSDHGEELADDLNKQFGHGLPILTRKQIEVPFFTWNLPNSAKIASQKLSLNNFLYLFSDLYSITFKRNRSPNNKKRTIIDINKKIYSYEDLK